MAATDVEAYLRQLIEKQPACLVRLSEDGMFLAVNDLALSLLGAERLDQVLDTSLLDLVEPGQREECRGFLAQIAAGERGALEIELQGLGGARQAFQIRAVPVPDPLDGCRSSLCTFREITEHRRLQAALVDAAAREQKDAAAHEAAQSRLAADLEEARRARADVEAGAADAESRLAAAERRLDEAAGQDAEERARLRQELDRAGEELERQRQQILELEQGARDGEALRQSLAAEHAAAEDRWRERVESASADRAGEVQELRDELTRVQQSLERTEAAHHESAALLQARLRDLEADRSAAAAEAEGRRAEQQAEIERLLERLARAAADGESLAGNLSFVTAERDALAGEVKRSARLARAGRLAASVAADLDAVLTALVARSRAALGGAPETDRPEILPAIAQTALEARGLVSQLAATIETPPREDDGAAGTESSSDVTEH